MLPVLVLLLFAVPLLVLGLGTPRLIPTAPGLLWSGSLPS